MTTTTTIFQSPWCSLISRPDPAGRPYYMLDVADYVAVVAMTPDRRLILVRQFRPVVNRATLELPSGHVDAGETPEAAAGRELFEETGARAGELSLLGVLVPDVGRLTNRMWCFFAGDVAPGTGPQHADEGITVEIVSERDTIRMIMEGSIDHALNLAVLFLAAARGKIVLP